MTDNPVLRFSCKYQVASIYMLFSLFCFYFLYHSHSSLSQCWPLFLISSDTNFLKKKQSYVLFFMSNAIIKLSSSLMWKEKWIEVSFWWRCNIKSKKQMLCLKSCGILGDNYRSVMKLKERTCRLQLHCYTRYILDDIYERIHLLTIYSKSKISWEFVYECKNAKSKITASVPSLI